MKFKAALVAGLTLLLSLGLPSTGICAKDLSGVWQGTLPSFRGPLRLVLTIAKSNSHWKSALYSIDEGDEPMHVSSLKVSGSHLKLQVDNSFAGPLTREYDGTISADGNTISGTYIGLGPTEPLTLTRATKQTAWAMESRPIQRFVTVEKGVKLEVLDWGGSGRPLVLLAGLGNVADNFHKFAHDLMPTYHVYAITRRGYGLSSQPAFTAANYSADRLGDDVIAVIDTLKIHRPILVGHSIAGEELSSIGTRYPKKVAALVYLDAGYSYAYYDPAHGDMTIDMNSLRDELAQLASGSGDQQHIVNDLLQNTLPQFTKDLQQQQSSMASLPAMPSMPPTPPVASAIMSGEEKFTAPIQVPILAIFAQPHLLPQLPPGMKLSPEQEAAVKAMDAAMKANDVLMGAQVDAFERGQPAAHIVRIPNADHYVFISNEADVLRDLNAFVQSLP